MLDSQDKRLDLVLKDEGANGKIRLAISGQKENHRQSTMETARTAM